MAHWMDGAFSWDDLLGRIAAGQVGAAWVSGGYPSRRVNQQVADRFDALQLLVVQDLFDSPLWRRADYQLPGAAFAERSGAYVNWADRLQSVSWAIRPPAGVQPEGRLLWRLLEMPGLYDARTVLSQVAAEIPYFAAAAAEVVAGNGIKVYLCPRAMPTPVISYGVQAQSAGGAIIITASHNTGMWNGFKYKTEHGSSAPTEVIGELEKELLPH